MLREYRENAYEFWNGIHKNAERSSIRTDDWLDKFEEIIMASSKPVLDLGCGGGNDTLYLVEKGREIEHHLYETGSMMIKRFFDEEDIKYFFKEFEIEYMHEEVMKRYEHVKFLYRVCCRVPE